MYKILVLGVILSLQLGDVLGMRMHPLVDVLARRTHPFPIRPRQVIIDRSDVPRLHRPSYPIYRGWPIPPPALPANPIGLKNPAKGVNDLIDTPVQQPPTDVNSNNIPTDSISIPTQNSQTELSNSVNVVGRQLSSEYLVTKGIGAHKLHLRKLSWNKARKVCIDEGGQLADIRSDSEEKIILRMLSEDSVETAWIGYHDMFEEGEWVSVLGEPFGKSGWDRWWKKRLPNPDNGKGHGDVEEDCACLMKDGGGINDNSCSREFPFVCKIPAL